MYRSKIIKDFVDVFVTAPNQAFKSSVEVDKHASKIIGINFRSTFDDRMFYRGSQRLTINEREIYPEGYESKMIMQGLNVPANDRIVDLGEEMLPGNRKVEIEYRDTNHPSSAFTPYRVRLYIYSRIDNEA